MVFKNVVGTISQGLEEEHILSVFERICGEIGAKSDSKIGQLNVAGGITYDL